MMLNKNNTYKSLFLITFLAFFLCLPLQLSAKVINYKVEDYYVKDNNNNVYLIIRSFQLNNQSKLLAVNTKDFNTAVLSANTVTKFNPKIEQKIDKVFEIKPLKQGNNKKDVYLTVDLCPSSKRGFEEIFFKELINYGKTNNKTIHIAISLTKGWADKHKKEFNMLKEWGNNNSLVITWVNHSYTHFYNPKLPENKNFMLYDVKRFNQEVINNEIYMLDNGVIPSMFFRFPGLIYNQDLLNKLQKLHLVAIDANAWLAKTKGTFKAGSIILVHGNKNEAIGITLFLNLLNKGAIKKY